ncbi:MAG: hypothetical protein A3J79_05810, partial [Elusimicrobia bacterium RIFOXYB2_FULL_62_6]
MERAMTSTPRGVSFIVPAYNEERSIHDTIARIVDALSKTGIPHEIIVVNDGSTDTTREKVEAFPEVRVINHPVNIGYGNAIKAGIRNASYEWIGIVDADGSYPIEQIPALLEPMRNGYDMVVAVRANIHEVDGAVKRLFRRLFVRAIRLLNDARIQDPNSGFRVFRKEVAMGLMPFLCGTFSFTTSLTVLTAGLYYFIKYVPVTYAHRVGKSKVRHFRDSLRTLQYVTQGVIYFNPIKFFLLLLLAMAASVWLPCAAMAVAGLGKPSLACL